MAGELAGSGEPKTSRPTWRKSIASGTGNCVEVAFADQAVLVRDSKDPSGRSLRFTAAEWQAFLVGAQAGEFELAVLTDPAELAGTPPVAARH